MVIKLGYARVSTFKQSTRNQHDLLKAAGCSEIFDDPGVSGTQNHLGPVMQALFARVIELREQGEQVAVCVTVVDRFSRDTVAMIEGVTRLGKLGASFEPLDGFLAYRANDPGSELMLTIYAGIAQYERAQIKGRMDEGREIKVAKGLKLGAKPKLTQAAVDAIRLGYCLGKKPGQLATEWKISKTLAGRVLGIYPSLPPYTSLDAWEAAKEKANA